MAIMIGSASAWLFIFLKSTVSRGAAASRSLGMLSAMSRCSEVFEAAEASAALSTAASSFSLSCVKGWNSCSPPVTEKRATASAVLPCTRYAPS